MSMESINSVSSVNPTTKFESFKNTLNRGKDKAELAFGLYGVVLGGVRCSDEVFTPFYKTAQTFGKVLLPFRTVGILAAPFDVLNVGLGIKDTVEAPKRYKILSGLKVAGSFGNILDQIAGAVSLLEAVGLLCVRHASLIIAPLCIGSCFLQLAGIAISGWTLHSINKKERKIEGFLGHDSDKRTHEDYSSALKYIIKKPDTKVQIFKEKFLDIFSDKHKEKLEKIYEKAVDKTISIEDLKTTTKSLKSYIFHKKVKEVITIALLIIGIVGVLALVFAPTPLAPVFWGLLAGVSISAIGLLVHRYIITSRLDRTLLNLTKEI